MYFVKDLFWRSLSFLQGWLAEYRKTRYNWEAGTGDALKKGFRKVNRKDLNQEMDEIMTIRKAKIEELQTVLEIYAIARGFMVSTGNPEQWGEVYPPESLVRHDIESGACYVAEADGQIEAVFMYAFEDDPDYQVIEDGKWLNEDPYGVVHRVASRGNIKGIGAKCMLWGFEQCKNLKMDTHEDNRVMQHVLEKNGFVRCGRVYVADGMPMIAYQKIC